ncbi:39S ribosomal protein L15, mitochondrial [Puma concolor]|uniref:39S ribosomal protein L15, mitochondrial n=1 Tax=Puma concolor TaxID=9696 RepID=A0A6P6HRF0_PUMCO|nr:39S ribosomal protein L15, mitochondrial [Puma concolor]
MAGPLRAGGAGALDLLRALPRVSLANLKPTPGSRKAERRRRGQRRGRKCGRGHKGERQRGTRPRLGFEGGQTPFYIRIPKYGFNEDILCKPVPFFLRGQPIPKRMLPPEALVPYYTDAKNRGYLADPAKFPEARLELAKKYGYILPDITKDELFKMLSTRKDPRQIFFGLAPGWVVNMADKKILKPTDENLLKYYSS